MDEVDDVRRAQDGVNGSTGRAPQTAHPQRDTQWERVTRRYRRAPGGWWWLALLAVPLLLAAIGLAFNNDDDDKNGNATATSTPTASSSTTSPSPTSSATTAAGPAPFSVDRAGKKVTVTALVPDQATKTNLVKSVKDKAGDAEVVDHVTVKPGSVAPEAAALGTALTAADKAGDYTVDYQDGTVTLKGRAANDADKQAAGDAAKQAWPQATVDNQITTGDAAQAASCDTLSKDVDAILARTKPTFAPNSTTLTAQGSSVIQQVAAKAKSCPTATLAVTGYTDNIGTDALNDRLSSGRAAAVKQALVADGVSEDQVTASGKGSADPIASNGTAKGREQNRRVEITVS